MQTAEVLAAQAAVVDAVADSRAELGRLSASAQDVLGHGWQSGAAAAFGRGWDQWHEGARNVLVALDAIGASLGATGRTYAGHEAANVELLAS